MENEHDALVKEYLEKHFDVARVIPNREQVIVSCYLDSIVFLFPFYTIQYYEASPYDVVNTIWEYINNFM